MKISSTLQCIDLILSNYPAYDLEKVLDMSMTEFFFLTSLIKVRMEKP